MSKDQYETRYIPVNFESGITFAGISFRIRFLFEALVLAIILGGGTYLYLKNIAVIDSGTVIGISIAVAAISAALGLKGINDEPLSVFIFHLIRFVQSKDTAFYNPRIKTEMVPFDMERATLSRSKASVFLEAIKDKVNNATVKNPDAETEDSFDYVFEDDLRLQTKSRYVNRTSH